MTQFTLDAKFPTVKLLTSTFNAIYQEKKHNKNTGLILRSAFDYMYTSGFGEQTTHLGFGFMRTQEDINLFKAFGFSFRYT